MKEEMLFQILIPRTIYVCVFRVVPGRYCFLNVNKIIGEIFTHFMKR